MGNVRSKPADLSARQRASGPALGQYLASIRTDRGMTLRQVEDATEKQVSNAYLSQIENGKVRRPSPNILYVLAELYGVSFEGLMERAGYYLKSTARRPDTRHGRAATFAEHDLTPDEEAQLLDFLKFLRMRKRAHGST